MGKTNRIAISHEYEEAKVRKNRVTDPCWPKLDVISKVHVQCVWRDSYLGITHSRCRKHHIDPDKLQKIASLQRNEKGKISRSVAER